MSGALIKRSFYVKLFVALILLFTILLVSAPNRANAATIINTKPGVPVSLKIPDTDLLVKGCVASNSLVTIFDNGTTVGTSSSNANGLFSRLLTAQTPTIHHIETYFEDLNGTRSKKTSSNIALPAKTLTTITVNPAPTVKDSPDPVTVGSNIIFKGYTCPNKTVKLTIDGTRIYSTNSDASGFWQVAVNSIEFAIGTHIYNVSSSGSGFSSTTSQSHQFQVVASDESAVAVVGPNEIPPPIAQTPDDGTVIDGDTVTVSGESAPNAQINIYEDGVLYGSIFANNAGRWSFEYTATYSPVTLSFEACINGRCSVLSNTLTLYFEGLGVCKTDFRLLNYRYWDVNVDDEVQLAISYSTGSGVMHVDWGNNLVEKFDHNDQRPIDIINQYKKPGQYNGSVRFMQDDCEKVRYFSVYVAGSTQGFSYWIMLWLLLSILIVYVASEYYTHKQKN